MGQSKIVTRWSNAKHVDIIDINNEVLFSLILAGGSTEVDISTLISIQ